MARDLIQTIFARRSIRSFTDKPVELTDITTLLEAAMASPSASNLKPWHFIVVTDRLTMDKLAENHPYAEMLFEAMLCIVVCGDPAISARYWVQDCSAATENLLLAAVALELGAVWLGVYPIEERIDAVRKILKAPQTIVPLNLVALGHPAETKEPRTQYDATRVHREHW